MSAAGSEKSTYQADETDEEPSLDDLTLVFDRKLLIGQLDRLGHQIEQYSKEFKFDLNMTIATTAVATTAGYILWTQRGSFLVATILSSLPSWKFIDPLPVLETRSAKLDDSGESLASMVESSNALQ